MSMSLQEFEDLLDANGGDPGRWPPMQRAAADALLIASAEARDHHRAMLDVERLLAASAPSMPAIDRFASVATRHAQDADPTRSGASVRGIAGRRAPWRGPAGWGAAAAAAALALGMVVGSFTPAVHDDNPGQILASALDTTGSVDVD